MRVVLQRSLESKVEVDGKITGSIDNGLVILVGFTEGDTLEKIDYMVNKIVNLRIFDDENGVMNKSLLDVNSDTNIDVQDVNLEIGTSGFVNTYLLVVDILLALLVTQSQYAHRNVGTDVLEYKDRNTGIKT